MNCDDENCNQESDWALEADFAGGGRWNYCTEHLIEHVRSANEQDSDCITQLKRELEEARDVRREHECEIEYCLECGEIVSMGIELSPDECFEDHTIIVEGWNNLMLTNWINCLTYLETGELND